MIQISPANPKSDCNHVIASDRRERGDLLLTIKYAMHHEIAAVATAPSQ